MKKILVVFMLALFSLACSYYPPAVRLAPNVKINDDVKNAYYSSVSITTGIETEIYGSGTIIKGGKGKKLQIITAAHVIDHMNSKQMLVRARLIYKKELIPLVMVKIDKDFDLALMESIEPLTEDVPYVKIAGENPKIGDGVFTVGSPRGDPAILTNGILSDVSDGSGVPGFGSKARLYRATCPSYFGNSGGGLFDSSGELIGVTHALYLSQFGVQPGAFFWVSVETIRVFL